tara:strand:- start:166 stop:435 length:270 start_codon:yes stop_codon:yes gene_type:complete
MSALSLLVTGHVQGVFFRATTQEKAEELGLTGWVTNTKDGNVEMYAEGEPSALKKLEEWCASGPPSAIVESVTVKEVVEEGLKDFSIIH